MEASRSESARRVFVLACVLCAIAIVLLSHYEVFSDCTSTEKDLCVLKGPEWCSANTRCATVTSKSIQKVSPHGACSNGAPGNAEAATNPSVLSTHADLAFVISRYECDTAKFESNVQRRLNATVFVYDRRERNHSNIHYVHKNKGNEAAVFLKYVVDYYDHLHEYTIFSHEEEFSRHHDGSVVDLVMGELQKPVPAMYLNINNKSFYKIEQRAETAFRLWWDNYIERDIHWSDLPQPALRKAFKARCCAQMVVHRDRIRRLPLSFYQRIYDWIQNQDEVSSAYSGRFLEWTWHIIWGSFHDE